METVLVEDRAVGVPTRCLSGAVGLSRATTLTHSIIMRSLWKIWIDTEAEDKARRVFERARRVLGRDAVDQGIEPYPKTGGFLARFWVELGSERWNDGVVEVI
jgi:hypothetical protein